MKLAKNRSFTGNGKRSRLQCLKDGVQQGSILAPLLENIYMPDLSTTASKKYACVDGLNINQADGNWQSVDEVSVQRLQ